MKIYLDVDGTLVEHSFPAMGRCNFGCFEVIKKIQDSGHEIILNTYRVDISQESLQQALDLINLRACFLIKDRLNRSGDFELKPITQYTPKKIDPPRWDLHQIIKRGEIYIDDISFGIPLKPCVMTHGKMVDWDKVEKQLIEHQIITA